MPVGVEQWRAAVGAMAKASTPKPHSPIGPHWKKWLKASDPVAYKGCVVLLVSIAKLVCCNVEQVKEEREEMVNKGSECGFQLVSGRKTKVGSGQDCSVLIPSSLHLLLLCGYIALFGIEAHLNLQFHGKCLKKINWVEYGKEVIKAVLMCVCCFVWCLGLCQSLLMRDLPCWAWLVCRKCSKKTVTEGVDSLISLPFSNRVKPCLRVVTMIVFVNEMLLMIAGDVEPNPGPETLNPGDLATLVNELHEIRADWYDLGVQLRMTTSDLDVIKVVNMNDSKKCLRQMLSEWLRKTTPSLPSWQRVVDALCSPAIDRPALADKIRRTYCSQEQPSSTLSEILRGPRVPEGGAQKGRTRELDRDKDIGDTKKILVKYLNKGHLRDLFRELGLANATLQNTYENSSISQYADDLLQAWINKKDGVQEKGGPTWEGLERALTKERHHGAADEIQNLRKH